MIVKPHFNVPYESGLLAYADWVAGGNFDGYVYKKTLIFNEIGNRVTIKYTTLDQSNYDGEQGDFEISATFQYTDHETITITNNQVVQRGKILGDNRQYIAFSYLSPNLPELNEEAYQLVKYN